MIRWSYTLALAFNIASAENGFSASEVKLNIVNTCLTNKDAAGFIAYMESKFISYDGKPATLKSIKQLYCSGSKCDLVQSLIDDNGNIGLNSMQYGKCELLKSSPAIFIVQCGMNNFTVDFKSKKITQVEDAGARAEAICDVIMK